MNVTEAIRIALQSLWANKLRSILTLLGVVIGVAAVIAVVTFVNGIDGYVATKIFNLGADVFLVSKVSPVVTTVDELIEGQRRKDITVEDYTAVAEGCVHCELVGASTIQFGHVKFGNEDIADCMIRGFTPSMFGITDTDVVAGRPLNETDNSN